MINFIITILSKYKAVQILILVFILWLVASYFGQLISKNEQLNNKIKQLESSIITIRATNERALKLSYQQLEFERARYDNAKVIYEEATKRLANDRCATENIPSSVLDLLHRLDTDRKDNDIATSERKVQSK